jgi:zona occludens toxin
VGLGSSSGIFGGLSLSIVAYTGLPGSGKSYSVVEHQILPALKAGRLVVTNVPMRSEALAALKLPGELVEFPVEAVAAEPHRIREFVQPGCVFVLDEVWRLFPQGQQANKVPDEYKSLLAEHRHMVDVQKNSIQICFVVQDLANIGAFARRLVESTFVTTKLSYMGLSGSYRVDVFHGAQTGATPPVSSRLRFLTGKYRKEIFALYKSHTMAADSELSGANEKKIDGRANIFLRPSFILGAIAVPLMIWFGLHMFNKSFHHFSDGMPGAHPSRPGAAAQQSGAASPVPMATPLAAVSLPDIRLLFVVIDPKNYAGSIAYLGVGDRNVSLPLSECRKLVRNYVCRYQGAEYDGVGLVGPVAAPMDMSHASMVDLDATPSVALAKPADQASR